MGRCKNGDKFNFIHASFSADDFTDPDLAKSIWDVLMKYSFDICDLPITRKYGYRYSAATWTRRIKRYFMRLNKLIALQ